MQGSTNTPSKIFLVNWLAKVTDDSVRQSAGPVNVIGVGSNENRRNRAARLNEMSMEFEPSHGRHVDVSDQASCFNETRGREEIGGRWESLDAVPQRPYEPSHGIAKGLIILNDREQ
jgi:hypothetical protein